MQIIKIDGRVDSDGLLKLEVPFEVTHTEVEVIVVIQPKAKRRWPPGYFERTAGSLADSPIERPDQGEYETREPLG